mgnify:CR=1 FL=1
MQNLKTFVFDKGNNFYQIPESGSGSGFYTLGNNGITRLPSVGNNGMYVFGNNGGIHALNDIGSGHHHHHSHRHHQEVDMDNLYDQIDQIKEGAAALNEAFSAMNGFFGQQNLILI